MHKSSRRAGPIPGTSSTVTENNPLLRSFRRPFAERHDQSITRLICGGAILVLGAAIFGIAQYTRMPDGLVIPNPPSLAQKIENAVNTVASRLETKALAAPVPFATPAGLTAFDFDGDGKTDYSIWHASSTTFKVKAGAAASPTPYTLGSGASVPAPADFDGDGIADAAVFSAGQWSIRWSSDGSSHTYSFGQAGDVPKAADYDGDGKADLAVWRPSNGYWWYTKSSDSSVNSYQFGSIGDIPVIGNFDGDSQADFAVFRQSTGNFYIQQSTAGYAAIHWGQAGDIPVPGDYDGDGKTDPAVFRGSTGTWYMLSSSSGYSSYTSYAWGTYGDEPVPGDYDGDGITDKAVWRATTGDWWVTKSSDSTYYSVNFGVTGDIAVPSAYLKQIGGHVTGYDVAPLRLSPKQATGGTNYYSQNFGWSRTLVNLPGRSGLDAAFGISYNSLVWLKDADNATIYFDPDAGNVGPGFRFGFPVIEQAYYDAGKSTFCYIMVTPDGGRKEFRQTAASNVYEAADSSYAQIVTDSETNANTPVTSLTPILKTTDGTQMSFEWKGTAFHAKEIKDRNGNYITITNDDDGLMTQVTDTLGRTINISYDEDLFPTDITQTWRESNGAGSATTHNWAAFHYTTKTLDLSFSGLTVAGPISNASIKVLDYISYPDGSRTKFEYNTFGQVKKISNIAADSTSHILNYVSTNLDSVSGSQTASPLLTSTNTWVENFNGDAAVTVTNSAPATSSFTGADGSETTSVVNVAMSGDPYDHYTRIHFGPSGYKEGLTTATEDCTDTSSTHACTTRVRWTWNRFTQDNAGLAYILNPRITETRVGDGTNTKVTTIEYYEPTTGVFPYGLPKTVSVGDGTTVLKTQKTTYNLDADYVSKRIIGLPATTELFEGTDTGTIMSKVTYAYDYGDFSDSGLSQDISPTHHDGTNYGSSFVTGRGLLTSITRCDASSSGPSTCYGGITSSIKYNTAGLPVANISPIDGTYSRTVRIGYADNYNTTPGDPTYAYPTTITDPAGSSLGDAAHSSTVKYRFDIGAPIEAVAVPRSGTTAEKKTVNTYSDTTGRVAKQALWNKPSGSWVEHAYTRFEYPENGIELKKFATLVDVDGDGDIAEDEALADTWFDGAGRTVRTRTPHPGSTGGWSAVLTDYDILGQVYRQSVPTEVSVSGSTWTAAGDDYTRGFVYNSTEYDWKGRPTRTIPSDSNGSDGKDTLISYAGCGCAGNQVTTIQWPSVPRDDTSGNARRKQISYDDVLGRNTKTEVYKWDGATVLTSTVNTFNARDQITNTRQYDGSTSSGTYRDVTMTFDGHGRMATRHYPIEDAGTFTAWTYNADDTIAVITDPRMAKTAFTYENASGVPKRPLVTKIEYTPHSGGVDAPDVTLAYDNAGNRISMDTAGVSNVTYAYDSLSRMTSEAVDFDDLANDLTIGYTYGITGLTSITDPFGSEIDYANDKLGRVTVVTGDAFAENTTGNYADNIKYRAFGQVKQMDYKMPGGDSHIKLEYDSGLRVTHAETSLAGSTTSFLLKADYSYFADGRVAAKDDLLDDKWDRTNKYDFAGRLTFGQFGTDTATGKRVYEETVSYNAFSEMGRTTKYWDMSGGFSASYTNGRKSGPGAAPTYDAAGNITFEIQDSYSQQISTFDASGRRIAMRDRWRMGSSASEEHETDYKFDGDGHPVIESVGTRSSPYSGPMVTTPVEYQVWSSVLGSSLTTVNASGGKVETKVFAGGTHIATQQGDGGGIVYSTADPVTGTVGQFSGSGSTAQKLEESEPFGQKIELTDPGTSYPATYQAVLGGGRDPEWQCTIARAMGNQFLDMPVHCQKAAAMQASFSIVSAFGFSLSEKSPNNTSQSPDGTRHGSGSLETGLSPSNALLASTATATYKASASPDCDITNCAVDVNDPDIPGFVDASSGGDLKAQAQNSTCGVNPVTNSPGIVDDRSNPQTGLRVGGLGNIRPGNGGNGGFRERSNGKHDATDIVAPVGTTIFANLEGTVIQAVSGYRLANTAANRAAQFGGLGNTVVIDHGGFYTLYSHLTDVYVVFGDFVTEGMAIGTAGRTGNANNNQQPPQDDHVHFGVFYGSVKKNGLPASKSQYRNPVKYLNNPCPHGQASSRG